jgi:hypothetical protein
MMPALITLGLPPHLTLGTNKIQSMCGTTMATWRYHRAGLFTLRGNGLLVAVTFAGALVGALVIQHFDARAVADRAGAADRRGALYRAFAAHGRWRSPRSGGAARVPARGRRRGIL